MFGTETIPLRITELRIIVELVWTATLKKVKEKREVPKKPKTSVTLIDRHRFRGLLKNITEHLSFLYKHPFHINLIKITKAFQQEIPYYFII